MGKKTRTTLVGIIVESHAFLKHQELFRPGSSNTKIFSPVI
jgi:hypothetical protein